MDKQTLIDLFERRDKKRRRILYRLYQQLIESEMSAVYIADMICKQLGREGMINAADIKFCRYHFKKRPLKPLTKQAVHPPSFISREVQPENPLKIKESTGWTDPDKIDLQKNLIVKSKFAKEP